MRRSTASARAGRCRLPRAKSPVVPEDRSSDAPRRLREPPPQRIRHRLGDFDVDVAIDQRGRPVEVHPAAVAGAPRELAGVAARRALDQHALYRAHHCSRVARGLLADQRLQPLEPSLLFIVRHVVRERGRGRSGTAAVDEAVRLVEAHIGDQVQRRLEVALGLSRIAHDEIARQADVRPNFAQPAELLLVLEDGVAALHQREHAVRAALHGQVQVVRELGHVAESLDQAVAELDRMRGREANTLDAGNFGDEIDQRGEIGMAAAVHRAAVGVYVLTEQRDLAHSLRGETFEFLEHLLERPTDLLAARVRHDAEAAVLAAAFHHRYERGCSTGPRFGQSVELLDLWKAHVDNGSPLRAKLVDHRGQPVQRLRSEDEIHKGRARGDALAFLARYTAADTNDHAGSPRLYLTPPPELRKHLLLRLLAHRAGRSEERRVG